VILSLDTAYKIGSTNDYSVAVIMGVAENGYYLLDCWRKRAEFPDLKRAIEMLALKWKPDRVLVEDKGSGTSVVQELRNGRLAVTPIKVDSDKVTRATAITPMVEAGKVLLPEGAPWLADFIEEISSFPAAPHDDQVDALSQALNFVRESPSYSTMMEIYKNQTAIEVYRASANYGMAAQQSGLSISEVEALVADTDEVTRVYEDEMNRLQGGPQVEYSYGDRPTIASLTEQALIDIRRRR
jgi:predicted phage terminase large subunit-like protein